MTSTYTTGLFGWTIQYSREVLRWRQIEENSSSGGRRIVYSTAGRLPKAINRVQWYGDMLVFESVIRVEKRPERSKIC